MDRQTKKREGRREDMSICGARERNRGYALLMTANKPETTLYGAPTFSLLLVLHSGISSWFDVERGIKGRINVRVIER